MKVDQLSLTNYRCYRELEARFGSGRTLVLGPNLIEAYYELGHAKWAAGDQDGGRETWTKGAKANKLSAWGKRCQETLDAIDRGEQPTR